MRRRAKIVATLGPTSNTLKKIRQLVEAGMDVARLNFSHGTHNSHKQIIEILLGLSKEFNKPITIIQDLQGPKLRVGDLPEKGVKLSAGEVIHLELDEKYRDIGFKDGKPKTIYLDIPDILQYLKEGRKILLDDGKLEMEIIKVSERSMDARVILGGTLYSNKGVNLPGTNLDVPIFTDKDKEDLAYGLDNGIDAVAISFVRNGKDIKDVRDFIRKHDPGKSTIPIIAKLELPQAVENLESILDVAEGVMVARGDLGVETSPFQVPIIQKEIIHAANRKNKLVITATQMLDSMINNPRPTRAEASDVANAIFDGTDAVMLSGETANGKYPVESVKTMHSIVEEAEKNIEDWGHYNKTGIGRDQDDAAAISIAARELAHDREVAAVAVFTQSGRTALLQSKARPEVPILAFTPNYATYRKLGLYWGVIPHRVPFSDTLEEMIRYVEKALIPYPGINEGEKIVLICGFPIGAMCATNLALIHTIGSLNNN